MRLNVIQEVRCEGCPHFVSRCSATGVECRKLQEESGCPDARVRPEHGDVCAVFGPESEVGRQARTQWWNKLKWAAEAEAPMYSRQWMARYGKEELGGWDEERAWPWVRKALGRGGPCSKALKRLEYRIKHQCRLLEKATGRRVDPNKLYARYMEDPSC